MYEIRHTRCMLDPNNLGTEDNAVYTEWNEGDPNESHAVLFRSWSLYKRDAEGLANWICDCGTEKDARRIGESLGGAV